jgi:hypothetical protein
MSGNAAINLQLGFFKSVSNFFREVIGIFCGPFSYRKISTILVPYGSAGELAVERSVAFLLTP